MTIPLPVGIILCLIYLGLLVWLIGRGSSGRGSMSGGMGTL